MKPSGKLLKVILITFCCLVGIGIFALLTWPLPLMVFGNLFAGLAGFFTYTAFWSSVGVVLAILLAVVLFIIFIWPWIAFTLKRIYVYVSFAGLCVRRKYRLRMVRAPFASLLKMNTHGDITISTVDGVLHLHFLDIVYPRKRMLTFPSEGEYVITPVAQGKILREGVANPVPVAGSQLQAGHRRIIWRASEYSVQRNKDQVKKLPTVSEQAGERHIIVMQTLPVDVRLIQAGGGKISVTNGTSVGNFTFCTVRHVKKGLKNQLHESLFAAETF